MRLKTLLASALFFAISCLSVAADAQAKSCKLDLSVTQFQNNSDAEEMPIQNAAATATSANGKITKASLFEAMPVFAKLREGKYTITVSKSGYKRTIKQVEINCEGLDTDGSLSEIIFLQKGSLKETYKMSYGVTAIVAEAGPAVSLPQSNGQNSDSASTSAGVLNGNASNLVKPKYPIAAKAVRASGAVNVQVTIDELGKVISAAAVNGHPLLRAAAVQAARESHFSPTILSGQPVKITGIIVYNFTAPQ